MRRYYLCPLVQDERGRWVPSIRLSQAWADQALIGASMAIVTSDFDAQGQPRVPWCLVIVKVTDHAVLSALPDVDILPDFPLDAKMASMQNQTRNRLRTRLAARGVDVTAFDNTDGFRDVITLVARTHLANSGFDADAFTVL